MALVIALFCIVVHFAELKSSLAGEWRIADQPNLKQELENAQTLNTESLGESARGVNVWERWFVPNHDGKSWVLLQIYF